MAFTPVTEESVGMDSPHHQHGEVLLSLLARHKSLEGKQYGQLFSSLIHWYCCLLDCACYCFHNTRKMSAWIKVKYLAN